MPPNKPARRAGQAIQACFILRQEFQACCPRAESNHLLEALDGEVRDQAAALELLARASHNFIMCIPDFREVIERDCFIALWGFLHLVDQKNKAMDKSNKIYKVRPMLDRMLPLFCLCTKNHLAIKQYICKKPVRWGIKSFLLCEAKTCYILDAEIYKAAGSRTPPLSPPRISLQRCPPSRGELSGRQQKLHAVHKMFLQLCRSVVLFHLLKKDELGVLASGSVMPSLEGLQLYNARRGSTVNRRVGARHAQLTTP